MNNIYCRLFLSVIFTLSYSNCFSQIISGVIFDGKSNKPLQGASIYFDNTTIGTTSDSHGKFKIEYLKGLKVDLIISFIGYKTLVLDSFDLEGKSEFFLYESNNSLTEVVLSVNDGWSRELKLNEFRKHYLGESKNGLSCQIINEEDIILKYNRSKRQLTAIIKKPILIKNNNLKYLLSIDLEHFEVNYAFVSKNKKNLKLDKVYYSGAIFFKSVEIEPSISTIEKRRNNYFGSTLHFMRSLASEKLFRNGYRVYKGSIPVITNVTTPARAKKYITVVSMDSLNKVKVKVEGRIEILYKGHRRSSLESFIPEFYVDDFGNHAPLDKVKFGGDFGFQRMGDTLPLDFLLAK